MASEIKCRPHLKRVIKEVKPNQTVNVSNYGYNPTQIKQVYGISSIPYTGSGQLIAIIDAFGYPSLASDLTVFSQTFNLPIPRVVTTLQQLKSTAPAGTFNLMIQKMASNIANDQGWSLETALDVQWSHAIAPGANILVVQAVSDSFSDLLAAVSYATNAGATVVSMSWGGGEFSSETLYDSYFNPNRNIVYVASAGDSPGPEYPAVSPNVLAVGGTTLEIKQTGGVASRASETVWYTNAEEATGGGLSNYETKPLYQQLALTTKNDPKNKRGAIDVVFDANPATGVPVYNTYYNPGESWYQIGGTSFSAPAWAGIIAITNNMRAAKLKASLSGTQIHNALYNLLTNSIDYNACMYDIKQGSSNGYSATTGYDLASGLGSPNVLYLSTYLSSV